ncbi:hypothetical protein [Bosea psychrotolerans]|uniref:hypothetical protein n=1 Tax=Bosea psychrotolerans TaxID=1871628 RepID=UPI000CDAF311|nr:hypothetical protein [Bosea psychrotolerans]
MISFPIVIASLVLAYFLAVDIIAVTGDQIHHGQDGILCDDDAQEIVGHDGVPAKFSALDVECEAARDRAITRLSSAVKIPYIAVGTAAVSTILALLTDHARADDGDLQRALFDARCVNAKLKALPPIGRALLYEAECAGKPPKVIQIICTGGHCFTDYRGAARDELNDD